MMLQGLAPESLIMREFKQKRWAILEEHRRSAAEFPLEILVWGPGNDGSVEYQTRCALRDELTRRGHDAQFSEDLIKEAGALKDPIHDETLQADAAHLIFVLYGSRGTQTERDMILSLAGISSKTVILIEETMYETVKARSLAGVNWETANRASRIITYRKEDLACTLVPKAVELAQEFRMAYYVRALRHRER